ncbi:hypothetical protein C8Q73DRAFT_668881 [Cubamyces lactineus]|nr:hypothetical protein C8Q73DRAFT_668881 [Cubamyces lactineus]
MSIATLFNNLPTIGSGLIVFTEEEQVLSFITDPVLSSTSKMLQFSTGSLSARVARALVTYLRGPACAAGVTHLIIEDPEELLASTANRSLVVAFAALSTLTHLTLLGVGPLSRMLLSKMQAKLTDVTLEIEPHDDEEGSDDPATCLNPIALLRNFQDSLVHINGQGIQTIWTEEMALAPQYPKLKSVAFTDADIPFTSDYVRAFPNITALRLRTSPHEYEELLGCRPEKFEENREANVLLQLQRGTWSQTLQFCDSTLGTLYILALQCRVKELRVTCDINAPRMLGRVLYDTRPTILSLEQFPLDMLAGRAFASSMRASYAAQLRSLEIMLMLDGDSGKEGNAGIAAALNSLVKALQPLKIERFGLCLGCNFRGVYPYERGMPASAVPLTRSEEYLRDLELNSLAQRIHESVAALKSVVVVMMGHRTRAAEMVSVGDRAGCQALKMFKVAALVGRG